MAKPLMIVVGMDGEVHLLPDRVVIMRKGLWNAVKFGFNAQRDIPLSAIHEIGFKNANVLMFGQIDFVSGSQNMMSYGGKKKKVNPNAVKFKRDKQKPFEMLKEKVFELMAKQQNQRKA
jgi:hypothetical protein